MKVDAQKSNPVRARRQASPAVASLRGKIAMSTMRGDTAAAEAFRQQLAVQMLAERIEAGLVGKYAPTPEQRRELAAPLLDGLEDGPAA